MQVDFIIGVQLELKFTVHNSGDLLLNDASVDDAPEKLAFDLGTTFTGDFEGTFGIIIGLSGNVFTPLT